MKKLLLVIVFALPLVCVAQEASESSAEFRDPEVREPGIYDSSGKKVLSIVGTGETETVVTMDGPKNYSTSVLTDLASGQTYTYSHRWDQTMSNGEVFMNYHFNKRQWYWAEGKGIQLGGRVKGDTIRRTYRNSKGVMTTTEHGDYPILRYKDGRYLNEFGEPVYSLVGRFPGWATIVLLHKYYEEVYESDAVDSILARRAEAAAQFATQNTIAVELLHWDRNFKTKHRRDITYFTDIEGQIHILSPEQVRKIQNQWLVLEKERWHSSYGWLHAAGFAVSERKAKKRGVGGRGERKRLILEIKVKPEFQADFRSAILEAEPDYS